MSVPSGTPTGIGGVQASHMIARLAYRRLFRTRAFWVSLVLLALPLAFTVIGDDVAASWRTAFSILIPMLAVIPPIYLASAISEEVDGQTFTYLWSRPIPRWSLVGGKLAGLAPAAAVAMAAVAALIYVMTVGSAQGDGDPALLGRSTAAIALGALAACMVSVGIGSIVTKHALAAAVAYLLLIDLSLGSIPFAINVISISYNVRVIAGLEGESQYAQAARMMGVEGPPEPAVAAVWMLCVGGAFLALALWRVGKTEHAAKK